MGGRTPTYTKASNVGSIPITSTKFKLAFNAHPLEYTFRPRALRLLSWCSRSRIGGFWCVLCNWLPSGVGRFQIIHQARASYSGNMGAWVDFLQVSLFDEVVNRTPRFVPKQGLCLEDAVLLDSRVNAHRFLHLLILHSKTYSCTTMHNFIAWYLAIKLS